MFLFLINVKVKLFLIEFNLLFGVEFLKLIEIFLIDLFFILVELFFKKFFNSLICLVKEFLFLSCFIMVLGKNFFFFFDILDDKVIRLLKVEKVFLFLFFLILVILFLNDLYEVIVLVVVFI